VRHFEFSTRIASPADVVWRRVTAPLGINAELMPVMRMTLPASMRAKTIADVQPVAHLGRSWLLLFGILPFDVDDISIAELEPGRRFLERSSMLSMKLWEHERTVIPDGDACQLRDRIRFELRVGSRIPGPERLLRWGLLRLFAHRHRRVARYFTTTNPTSAH
jgi:ligand-binding SRPBCC domain-containing protein